MKKLLLGITVLSFVLFASSAMAAGPKVPKALCLDFTGYSDTQQLVIKSLGNLPSTGGNIKMYAITGNINWHGSHPVAGNGYVVPGTTTFRATYSGLTDYLNNTVVAYDLSFDLTTNSGTVNARYLYGDATTPYSGIDLGVVSTSCSLLSITSVASASDSFDNKATGE